MVETTSPREAQRLLAERPFDLLIVDNVMPQLSGLDLIRDYAATVPEGERAQVLMMTAHATVESAIEAMKLGALDYLQKPFEIDELLVVVSRALDHQRLRTEYIYLRSEHDEQFDHYGIIGRSRADSGDHRARRAGRQDQEHGAHHRRDRHRQGAGGARDPRSQRAARTCRSSRSIARRFPESLLESELFGHVRGAFTGATNSKKGKFALADGGSIFLDEIGTMSPALQAKLLRVLQEREFEPLGAERTESVDLRVIAATNRDLRQMVADGRFQEDLFYRLNVIPIELPAAARATRRHSAAGRALRREARPADRPARRSARRGGDRALQQYDWPGNVRELENTIERAVVLSTGPVITARADFGARRDGAAEFRTAVVEAASRISSGSRRKRSDAHSKALAASRRTRPS